MRATCRRLHPVCLLAQVAQLDGAVPHPATPGHAEPRMVDVVDLMAAVLEDSPSNRLTMLQTSGVVLLKQRHGCFSGRYQVPAVVMIWIDVVMQLPVSVLPP